MKTALLALSLIGLASTSVWAANYSWSGGGTPVGDQYLWSDKDNWSEGEVPPTGSTIYFRTAAGADILLTAPTSLTNIWFQPLADLSGPAGSFTLSGAPITITNTLGIQNQSLSHQIINSDLIFAASGESTIRGFRYSNTAPLNLPGNITINGNVTADNGIYFRADNGSVITVNGSVAGTGGSAISAKTGGDSSGYVYLRGVNNIANLSVGAGRTYIDNAAAVNVGVGVHLNGDGAFLFMNGYDLEISSLTNDGSNNGRQRIYNGSDTKTILTYNRSTTDQVFTGNLSDATATNNANYTFVKKGSNTLTLAPVTTSTSSAGNYYTGGTIVQEGTLLIDSPLSPNTAAGRGAIEVLSGATFGGDGYAVGAVTVEGTLRVGLGESASGTLRLGGALTLDSDSIIELSLGADGAHSTLARTGTGVWTFDSNQQFTLVDFGMESGTYTGVITGLSSVVDTSGWVVTNPGLSATFTYNSGNIDLTISVIPEPTTAMSLLAAAGVLAWSGTRRRKRD